MSPGDDIRQQVQMALGALANSCGPYTRAEGFTYAVRQVGSKVIKIGKTIDPMKRMIDLQNMNGARLQLISLSHHENLERHLHDKHSHTRSHGEWFTLKEDPMPHVDGFCLGCRTFSIIVPQSKWLEDLETIEVPDVPVDIGRIETGSQIGTWHERDHDPMRYLGFPMHGGARDAALAIATTKDHRRTVLSFALASAVRTGSSWLFESDAIRDLVVSAPAHPRSWEFWPGMGRCDTKNWFELLPILKQNIAELATLRVSVKLFTPFPNESP